MEFVLERSYGIILPAILDACAKYVSRYKINKSISTNYLRRNPAIGEKTFDAIVSLVYPEFSPENSDKLFMNMLSYKSDEEGNFFLRDTLCLFFCHREYFEFCCKYTEGNMELF